MNINTYKPNSLANQNRNVQVKTSVMDKIKTSLFHLFLYLTLMTVVSVAASAQCDGLSLACNNNLNISTNDECRAEICLDIVLESEFEDFTDSDYTIFIFDENDNTIATVAGDDCFIVGDSYVDQRLKVSVRLDECGASCWGWVNIEDKVGPRFQGCLDGSFPPVVLDCEAYLDLNLPMPGLAGDCGSTVTPTYVDEVIESSCESEISSIMTRTWIAEDAKGNISICTQEISVQRFDITDVVFPPDFIHVLEADEPCDRYIDLSTDSIESYSPGSGYPFGILCPNIMHSYNDIIASQCGVQIKILREWLVIDWCNGQTEIQGQVIKILDEDGPVVICRNPRTDFPANFDTLVYISNSNNCRTDIVLDPLALIDSTTAPLLVEDCSGVILDEVAYIPAIAGTDQPVAGPYRALEPNEQGLYIVPDITEQYVWVRYCYIDECGNGAAYNEPIEGTPQPADFTNCCFMEIEVVNGKEPIAICEGFTKVQLTNSSGVTAVPAENFSDNSFDLCGGSVSFEGMRNRNCETTDTQFGPYVHFCCSDVGRNVSVTLRVIDEDNNSSTCIATVNVMNMGTEIITCPVENVILDCTEEYHDPELTGRALSDGICGQETPIGFDSYDLSQYDVSCNIGSVYRTILNVGPDGDTTKICSQQIEVLADDESTFLEDDDYEFPDDVILDVCNELTVHPSNTGFPETDKEFGCINIGISYEDSNPIVSNTDSYCYTILRTWTVVDWCRYDPALPTINILYGTQEILVRNSEAPEVTCPAMLMASADTLECRAYIELTAEVSEVCHTPGVITWAIDADSDGIIDLTGTDSPSGIYPVGTHLITYTGRNECGGPSAQCVTEFVIKGDRAPLPICLASVTWTLNENGVAEIWASDFDQKSEGGCDGTDSLTFSFKSPLDAAYPETARNFDCDDIPNGVTNTINLEVYVVDESEVFAACSVILILQDSNDECLDLNTITTIGGNLITEMDQPIENVMVELESMSDNSTAMIMSNVSGGYEFDEVAFYEDYIIAPQHNVDPLNGVSTLDLVQIQRHVLGIQPLDSPYKMIAADINNDNLVNGLDLVQLRKLILGIFTELPQNDSWVFVSDDFEFTDTYNPWDYTNSYSIEDLLVSDMQADFVGVKIGDVNNSVEMGLVGTTLDNRANSPVYLSGVNSEVSAGELVELPFIVEESTEIAGMQFTIEFDAEKLVFQGLDGASLSMGDQNFALLNTHDGVITVSFNKAEYFDINKGENLFNLYFEAKTKLELSEVVKVNSSVLESEAYLNSSEIAKVEYIFRSNEIVSANEVELFQNQPNPFSAETVIAFSLPHKQEVILTVYDSEGRVVAEMQDSFGKGINEFVLNSDKLNSNGILIYRLQSGETSITKKMLLVK